MRALASIQKIACLAVLLGAGLAMEGRCAMAEYPSVPAPAISLLPSTFAEPALPPVPAPERWNEVSDTRLLSSSLEISPVEPIGSEEAPADDRLIFPILIVIIAGAVWRFYTSPAYRRLYDAAYGPLKQY